MSIRPLNRTDKHDRALFEYRHEVRRTGTREDVERFAEIMRRHLDAAKQDHASGARACTVIEALEPWLEWKRANGRDPGYVRSCERIVRRLAGELAADGDLPLDRITARALEAYQVRRRREVEASTVNLEVSRLKGLARWAIESGRWTTSADGVRWLQVPQLDHRPRRPEPLAPARLGRALGVLPQHVLWPLLFQFIAGDRPGAVCAFKWGHVTWPSALLPGALHLLGRKGGAPRALRFTDGDPFHLLLQRARSLFRRVKHRAPRAADPVFVTLRGRAWTTSTLDHAVRRWQKRSGITGRALVTPYTLRHSCGTLAARLGAGASGVQVMLGQKTREVGERYVHLTGDDADGVRGQIMEAFGPVLERLLARPEHAGNAGAENAARREAHGRA